MPPSANPPKNPLRAFLRIKRDELPLALLMFTYFFLVITVFWILKPIKKTLFLAYYDNGGLNLFGWVLRGSQAELLAKTANMGGAIVAAAMISILATRWRREQLTFVFSALSVLIMLGFVAITGTSSGPAVWGIYLFGDMFNMIMVATFFAFLNDSFRPEAAKRNYGIIILGGVSGGAFGSMFVRSQVQRLSPSDWIWICIGAVFLIVVVAGLAGREVRRRGVPDHGSNERLPDQGNPAFEGAKLVARSRYLLALVAIVAIYEVVSTILDYQFTAAVEHYTHGAERREYIATVYAITNIAALMIQLFVTSFVLTNLGVYAALLIMPVMVLGASAGFLLLPILHIGGSLNTVDNGLNYSINQSAREALYTPRNADEKYKAKAFIDVFVQRLAKTTAVIVALAVTTVFTSYQSTRILSVVVIALAIVWIYAAMYAGRRFEAAEHQEHPMKD